MSKRRQHPVEKRCPRQVKEFRRILDQLYSIHLDKNEDYSPHNILATGSIGVTVRIWDKAARLMNLSGFDVRNGAYHGEKPAKHESIDDTLLDQANYCIIALLVRKGHWGK